MLNSKWDEAPSAISVIVFPWNIIINAAPGPLHSEFQIRCSRFFYFVFWFWVIISNLECLQLADANAIHFRYRLWCIHLELWTGSFTETTQIVPSVSVYQTLIDTLQPFRLAYLPRTWYKLGSFSCQCLRCLQCRLSLLTLYGGCQHLIKRWLNTKNKFHYIVPSVIACDK